MVSYIKDYFFPVEQQQQQQTKRDTETGHQVMNTTKDVSMAMQFRLASTSVHPSISSSISPTEYSTANESQGELYTSFDNNNSNNHLPAESYLAPARLKRLQRKIMHKYLTQNRTLERNECDRTNYHQSLDDIV